MKIKIKQDSVLVGDTVHALNDVLEVDDQVGKRLVKAEAAVDVLTNPTLDEPVELPLVALDPILRSLVQVAAEDLLITEREFGHLGRPQRRLHRDEQIVVLKRELFEGDGAHLACHALARIPRQKLADATGLMIHVHHYPPGTSKWNRIEHRLFCHITQTWRGRPLTDRLAVVELIAATTTNTGLKVESALDTRTYETGIKVSNAEMKNLDINGDPFHPEWNYTIRPRSSENRSA